MTKDDSWADLEECLDRPLPEMPKASDVQDSNVHVVFDESYPSVLLRYIVNKDRTHIMPILVTGYEPIQPLTFRKKPENHEGDII